MAAPALPVDREAVKMLCQAIGVRAAARKLGLSEDTVMSWSQRGRWFAQPAPVIPPGAQNRIAGIARKPSEVLAESLSELGKGTRLNLAKATHKAAKTFAGRSGDAVIEDAQALRHVTATASTLHSWEDKSTAGLTVNLGIAINGPLQ